MDIHIAPFFVLYMSSTILSALESWWVWSFNKNLGVKNSSAILIYILTDDLYICWMCVWMFPSIKRKKRLGIEKSMSYIKISCLYSFLTAHLGIGMWKQHISIKIFIKLTSSFHRGSSLFILFGNGNK